MNDFAWTDETCAQLRELWAEKHSTAEIGRRMGISKNAVVGKAHRLKLIPRPSPICTRDPNYVPRPKAPLRIKLAPKLTLGVTTSVATGRVTSALGLDKAAQQHSVVAVDYKREIVAQQLNRLAQLAVIAPTIKTSDAPSFLEIAQISRFSRPQAAPRRVTHGCLWPIGEPGRVGFRHCDDPARPGKPYCDDHCDIAYVKTRVADAA